MIQILFIIDYLESIIAIVPMNNEKIVKNKYKPKLKKLLAKIISSCSNKGERFVEIIDSDIEKVLALTLDEKYIVGAIMDDSDIPERHVWDSISEVFKIIPEYNVENHN